MTNRKVTWDEVARHNTPQEVWLVIDGQVYNPTPYFDDHPGGPAVMQSRAGRDATRDFNDTGHTANARQIMKAFHVGEIDTESVAQDWQVAGITGKGLDLKQLGMLAAAFLIVALLWNFMKSD